MCHEFSLNISKVAQSNVEFETEQGIKIIVPAVSVYTKMKLEEHIVVIIELVCSCAF